MPEPTPPKATNEISLPEILREELNHIKHRTPPADNSTAGEKPPEDLNQVFADFYRAGLSALCFSGGGIRSATFGLGIVQALAKAELLDKFDYLSTVSGGGYLGSWLSAWIRREQMNKLEAQLHETQSEIAGENAKKDEKDYRKILNLNEELSKLNLELFRAYRVSQDVGIKEVQQKLNEQSIPKTDSTCPNVEPKQLQYLREYSNYMSPKVGLLSADTWTLLGIYARNLFLNWTIFIPLISAVLLIPRILLAFVNLDGNAKSSSLILFTGLLFGIVSVIFTVYKLPSKTLDRGEVKYDTDSGVFITVILPMLAMAFAAATFWAWYNISGSTPEIYFDFLRSYLKYEKGNFIVFSVLIFLLGNLGFYLYKKIRSEKVKMKPEEILSAVFSSAVGGFLSWLIAYNFFDAAYFSNLRENPYNLPIYVCLAVPLYLLCYSVSSTIFAGLYSRVATDEDREWLARQGAWVLIVCGAWILLNGCVLFGPIQLGKLIAAIEHLLFSDDLHWIDFVKDSIVPLIVAVSGFISLVGGFSGESKVRNEPTKSSLSKFLSVAPQIAAVIFLAFIFVLLAYLTGIGLVLIANFLNNPFSNSPDWMLTDGGLLNILSQSSIGYLSGWLIGLSAIGIVMACFVNVNKFSLHAAYRDRLIRAYLGASHVKRMGNTFTGFDDSDNFQLHRLKSQKPFHIINATLNLVAGKNLAWQDRKAASFTMSPLHCGNWLLGYRHTNEYCRNTNLTKCEHLRYCNKSFEPCYRTDESGKRLYGVENCQLKGKALRLGTAMTISGAAANPNMGYYSSPVVTFLMSLFNIRLGWWLGNTGKRGDDKDIFGDQFYTKPSPSVAVLPLINETLGRTDENKHFLNVTDGGHFENLGLYETVLRRCKLIILSDAAADDNFTFSEISNAIEKCKVDLGVDIRFTNGINIFSRHQTIEDETSKKRFAIADIIYPEKEADGEHCKGTLLYIRPTFYGNESTEIKHYANLNNTFPHQSTADQLYDEKQFEAYRALGFYITEEIMKRKSAANLFSLLKTANHETTLTGQPDSAQTLPDLLGPESSDAV